MMGQAIRRFGFGGGLSLVAMLASIVAGCGGGGNSGGLPSGATGGTSQATSVRALLTILIPAKQPASSARRRMYVSPDTKSLVVFAIYGDQTPVIPQIIDVTATSQGCSQTTGGVICNVTVEIVRGATGLDITAFDKPKGRGNILAHATVVIPPTPNVDVINVSLTLSGVVQRLALALQGGPFQPGVAGTKALLVTAYDFDGDAIIGPGDYNAPILLSSSDSAVTLSRNFVTNPSQTVNATYNGAANAATSLTAYLSNNTNVEFVFQGVRNSSVNATPAPVPTITFTPTPVPSVPISSGSPSPGATAVIIIR